MNEGVSVVIPMKNAEKTIEKCIKSILSQDYFLIEVLVCDDGSDDCSVEIVEQMMQKYDNIRLFYNKASRGAANARNKCIKKAKYNYIAMQDADDWSASNRISREMEYMKSHPEYSIVGCGCYRVNEKGELQQVIEKENVETKDLVWGGHFIHASCIFKKTALLEVGGYTDNKYTARDQDYHLLMKLYAQGHRLYNMPECLYYYLSTDETYRRQIDIKKVWGLMWIRYDGYKRNRMPLWSYIYVFKPLVAAVIPARIMMKYYKRK